MQQSQTGKLLVTIVFWRASEGIGIDDKNAWAARCVLSVSSFVSMATICGYHRNSQISISAQRSTGLLSIRCYKRERTITQARGATLPRTQA